MEILWGSLALIGLLRQPRFVIGCFLFDGGEQSIESLARIDGHIFRAAHAKLAETTEEINIDDTPLRLSRMHEIVECNRAAIGGQNFGVHEDQALIRRLFGDDLERFA